MVWNPAKRLCVGSLPYIPRVCLRTRPDSASRSRASRSSADDFTDKGASARSRARAGQEKIEPDNLEGADEGFVSFDRAERELRRRLRIVGWQQRKGNAYKDRTTIECLAGRGGEGAVSFMHYPFAPDNTPPDGAGGGRGGNIYIRVSDTYHGLGHLPRRAQAGPGSRGQGDHRVGNRGQDVILEVPIGTLVKERRLPEDWPPPPLDEEEPPLESDWDDYADWERARRDRIFTFFPGLTPKQRIATPEDERFFRAEAEVLLHERLLARAELSRKAIDVDLVEKTEDPLLVAVGGDGGKGNMSFVGGYCRLPKFGTKGMRGQKVVLELELKSLADVGLVGYPNSGKSTLLRAMSESKAEIASYPFTTLRPHLGTVIVYDDGSFGEGKTGVIEDSPSYSDRFGPHNATELAKEQARQERELDDESADELAYTPIDKVETFRMVVADCPGILANASKDVGLGHDYLRHIERSPVLAYVVDLSSRDPARTLTVLRDELEAFQAGLSERVKLVVANKADALASQQEASARLAALAAIVPGLPILPTSARHRHNISRLVRSLQSHVEESRRRAAEAEPAQRQARQERLEAEIDSTVKRIGVFRRAAGINYVQYATPADREAAQQLYDTGFRRAKIEESRWLAAQGARRAIRLEQEAERKRMAWEERRMMREGLVSEETEFNHERTEAA